jgi:hypothetical protein
MALYSGRYWTGDSGVKPDQWGPVEAVQAAIRENADYFKLPVPLGYWPAWDQAGTKVQEVVAQRNATLVGPEWNKRSLNFVAENSDYVHANSHASAFSGLSTGALIIRFSASTQNTLQALFSISNPSVNNDYLIAYVGTGTSTWDDESINLVFKNNSGVYRNMFVRNGNTAYMDGKTYTVAYVIDGVDNCIYINGVKQTTWHLLGTATQKYFTNFSSNATAMKIGERCGQHNGSVMSGMHLDGAIDSVKIFGVPLTAEQVADEYANPHALIHPIVRRFYSRSIGDIVGFINCTTGDVNVYGIDTDIFKAVTINCTTGDVNIQGIDADIVNERNVDCTTGDVTIQGIDGDISQSTIIQATTNIIIILGIKTEVTNENAINCTTGNVSVQGITAMVSKGITLQTIIVDIIVSGMKSNVVNERIINCIAGNIITQGIEAIITSTNQIDCTTGVIIAFGIPALIKTDETSDQAIAFTLNTKELNMGMTTTLITQ